MDAKQSDTGIRERPFDALSKEVLVAIAADPVSAVTDGDVAEIETLLDREADHKPGRIGSARRSKS